MKSRMRFTVLKLARARFLYGFLMVLGCTTVSHTALATDGSLSLWEKRSEPVALAKQATQAAQDDGKPVSPSLYRKAYRASLNKGMLLDSLGLTSDGVMAAARSVATEQTLADSRKTITVPLPDGAHIELELVKESILPATLASKYPDIHTYKVLPNKQVFSGKVDVTPLGFHAMLHMFDGEVVFIDPESLTENHYAIYHKSAQRPARQRRHACGLNDKTLFGKRVNFRQHFTADNSIQASPVSADSLSASTVLSRDQKSLKTYKVAIATTGEYSQKFGANVGATLAAITTTLNRVNQVLERDLGIHLELIEDNDKLINTDPLSDPFTEEKLAELVLQNQDFIDSMIGSSNYDLGHLFATKGGGLAAIASVCNNSHKAKAASGITSPRGDSFDLDFVAHEIGHQLGATHSFNSTQGACNDKTRTARTAFEPGSGSSLMSYAGYCGLDNIQSHTDPMYHIGSIRQIVSYTQSGRGKFCGTLTPVQNVPPRVNAGKDYTIPARTPFELAGQASDADGDSLLYTWEQLDAGKTSAESVDKGDNALFRVHLPTASKTRVFPPLENILNHQTTKGETLPNYNRSLTMSFVALDGTNPAVSDEMRVKVVRTGSRFALHYPRSYYTRGNTYPVYWNVANTDRSPVNCSHVDVSMSIDGGKQFKYVLAEGVLNNGETSLTIPVDVPTSTQGRFKVKCVDNIFFAISHRNFFVTASDDSVSIKYSDEDQAEKNLADLPLNPSPAANSSVNANNTNTTSLNRSGGGVFTAPLMMLLFSLLYIVRRKAESGIND